jgi:hypothetical protein
MKEGDDAFERQVRLERRFTTTAFALNDLRPRVAPDPAILAPAGLAPRDVVDALSDLEAVYTVRLFSEFEATVRSVVRTLWPMLDLSRRTVRSLMDRVAARHHVVFDVLDDAHAVRRFRNSIVHRSPWAAPPTLGHCRSKLATFLSYLPRALLK